jgi:outer membrane protein assembly factor BamB
MFKSILITAILLLSCFTMLIYDVKAQTTTQPVAGPLSSGVTPSVTIRPEAYLAVNPNPIGVNQQLLINMWNQPPLNVARLFVQTFKVTVTKPDGTTDVLGPFSSYAGDSTAWTNYIPAEPGTYSFKFDFLGMYFPAGYYYQGNLVANGASGASFLDSVYYAPATAIVENVTVQTDMVASYPPAQLPTDYWTRPVSPNNREWWVILGSWPPTGVHGGGSSWPANTNTYMSSYRFVPYTTAPESAHVVWKLQGAIGGLMGGTAGQLSNVGSGGTPSIIYAGRCYMSVSEPPQAVYINGSFQYPTTVSGVTEWRCFDLRTGQIYWERPVASGETLPSIVTYEPGGAEVPGAEAMHTDNVYLVTLTAASGNNSGRVIKYNPYTGAVQYNFTGVPSGVSAGTFYNDPWVLSIQTIGSGQSVKYRLINWTIANNAGKETIGIGGGQPLVDNFTARIWGNVSWPFSSLGTVDFESGIAVTTGSISSTGTGVAVGQFIQAASLSTGNLLWNVSTDTSDGWGTFFSTINGVADHGKYAIRMLSGQWWAWDLNTGKIVWKSDMPELPWGSFGAYDVQSAYGLIFDNGYDGINAIDWNTGKFVWHFQAPSAPFETPYNGGFAWHATGMVADGKLYTFTAEHTPSQPITRGLRFYCINATTGQNIWNLTGYSGVSGSRTFPGAFADGYLTLASSYDGYTYVIGKGPSATTLSAPQTAISAGQSAVITGTVLDQSPAQQGKACVSTNTVNTYMEYLHMSAPIDGIYHNITVTGVPVSIDATDPNGNYVHLGTTTSDMTGAFGFTWTPTTTGDYKITASFAGDASYGSSFATTYATVTQPSTTSTPAPTQAASAQPPFELYFAATAISIILAIAIATVLIIRAKK